MALPQRGRFNPRFIRQPEPEHRINERIRVPQVRLVGDNVTIGIYPTQEALRIAQQQELDLVEISPNADPPVCKVIGQMLRRDGVWFPLRMNRSSYAFDNRYLDTVCRR